MSAKSEVNTVFGYVALFPLEAPLRISILAAAMAALLLVAPFAPARGQVPKDRIRLSIGQGNYAYLPIFLAVDQGFFAEQNLDVQITKYNGSANTQVPLLARGDLDITPVVLGPPIFNQLAQGFDLTLIASISQAHKGWNGATWLMVRQDLWDAGTIRKVTDLKGKRVDNGVVGTVADLMMREALTANNMPTTDVNLTYTVRGPADWYAGMRNKAFDAMGTVEPIASELEEQKLGHKWLTYNDVTPWIQDSYFGASAAFLKTHADVVRRFLIAVLKADRIVDASGGKWTPQLIDEVAKWTELPPADIARVPGPNYVGQFGSINFDSIARAENLLVAIGAVQQRVPPAQMADTGPLGAARKALGIR